MRKLLLVIGLSILMSCGEGKIPSESAISEKISGDTWGQLIEAPPETFFAADLSDEVRNGITNTLLAATEEWGNYGPLEYWVLGTDLEAAKDLAEQYCQRRAERGESEFSECLSETMDPERRHRFEYYRKIGADAVAQEKSGGSMGYNGMREWGIFLYMSSYPMSFDRLFNSSPAGAQKGVFHEYFHGIENAHIESTDTDERSALMGPPWFVEGGAEYMAHITVRKLWASGKLAILEGSDLGSLEEEFEKKMTRSKKAIEEHCPGLTLKDLTYDNECTGAAYGLGAWANAYLLNKVVQTALLDSFYPSLNELGWEGSFQKTFGMTSDEFYAEFNLFLEQPLADQLAILPKVD